MNIKFNIHVSTLLDETVGHSTAGFDIINI